MTGTIRLKVRKIDIEVMLLSLVCMCLLSPYILRTIGTMGVLVLIGVAALLEANRFFRIDVHERNSLILIALYIGLLILYTVLGISDKGAGQTGYVLFFMSYILFVPVYRHLERRHYIVLLTICILTVMVTLAQNYALWIRMGFRFTQQWYRRAGRREVIDTQYIGALVFFFGVLLCLFLYRKRAKTRFLYLAVAIMTFLFNITVTQRTIAVLLSIIMAVLLLLVNGKVTRGKIVRYTIFLVLLIVIVLNYQAVLLGFADLLNSDRIRARIISIINLITKRSYEEIEDGSLAVRLRLIRVSIQTFWRSFGNFLFGVGDKTNDTLVGNHSYFFDEFAKFGVFGGLLSCTVLATMLKTVRKMTDIDRDDPLHKLLTVIFIVVALRALIGGILSPAMGVILFVLTPSAFRVMKGDEAHLEKRVISQ